jgi:chemotaxis family two-component system sensor kinase Cph1
MAEVDNLFSDLPQKATLTDCDREPIHHPERIQQCGVLLSAGADSMRIERISENCADIFLRTPEELLERPLSEILSQHQRHAVAEFLGTTVPKRVPLRLFDFEARNGQYTCLAHRQGSSLLLEFEPSAHEDETAFDRMLKKLPLLFDGEKSLQGFAQFAVEEFREISGYDRVMFYRFASDASGEVLAEARREDLESFLGLHYPATDIPAQARRLYLLNPIRVIADVNGENPLVLRRRDRRHEPPLDLTFAHLRSVSPIHLEYLANMGVAATMSVSLIHNGKLEGLIACHHYSRRVLPYRLRTFCELMGRSIAQRFFELEGRERARESNRLTEAKEVLSAKMAVDLESHALPRVVERNAKQILDLVQADAGAVFVAGEIFPFGPPLPEAALRQFFQRVSPDGLITTSLHESGKDLVPPDFPCCGVVFASLQSREGDGIAWFRKEEETEIAWGGYPHAKQQDEGTMRLTPRKSFEKWVESRRGHSRDWSPDEVEVAKIFARLNFSILLENYKRRQTEAKLIASTRELARSNYDLQNFVHVASHDLQEPLRAIHGFLRILQKNHAPAIGESAAELIDHAMDGADRLSRMIDGLLAYSRVGRPRRLEAVSLDRLIAAARANLAALLDEVQAEIEVGPMPVVKVDPEQFTNVLQNLLNNAVKYRSEKPPHIRLWAQETESDWSLRVADNGIGIEPKLRAKIFGLFERLHGREAYEGSGIGLALCSKIVEAHGGSIGVEDSPLGGTCFMLRVPWDPKTMFPDAGGEA